MAKRDIRSMRTDLAAFAAEANLPSQHTTPAPKPAAPPPAPVAKEPAPVPKELPEAATPEPVVEPPATPEPEPKPKAKPKTKPKKASASASVPGQTRVAISLSNDVHIQLKIDAARGNTSVAALILQALKDAGYDVADEEIKDKRRG